ncbi:hypothetical protein IQ06DRAFT_61940 [Phaeosphaeriaceae sp. SRC1lsM3a]|nr:hypothetical protein IQ06DRAFT_61940 [Stagonospora sp. SRC1lsM3a]
MFVPQTTSDIGHHEADYACITFEPFRPGGPHQSQMAPTDHLTPELAADHHAQHPHLGEPMPTVAQDQFSACRPASRQHSDRRHELSSME